MDRHVNNTQLVSASALCSWYPSFTIAVAPQLLSLDLFKLLGGVLGGGSDGGGVSASILGLQINLLNNRPLLTATKTGFLGLGRRRRLQEAAQEASRQMSRRLLGNTWSPSHYRPTGYMRYPSLRYY
jgi:hypothetical protein